MRKTVYEIVDNKTGKLIETFLFSISIKSQKAPYLMYHLIDDKTGEQIRMFTFSVRVRVRLTEIDEYKKTHVLLDRM